MGPLQEFVLYDLPLSMTGVRRSLAVYFRKRCARMADSIRASFSLSASAHGSGLNNAGNMCSLNSNMQFFRQCLPIREGVAEAVRRWQWEVAQHDAAQAKQHPTGTGGRWFCVMLTSWCVWFRRRQSKARAARLHVCRVLIDFLLPIALRVVV